MRWLYRSLSVSAVGARLAEGVAATAAKARRLIVLSSMLTIQAEWRCPGVGQAMLAAGECQKTERLSVTKSSLSRRWPGWRKVGGQHSRARIKFKGLVLRLEKGTGRRYLISIGKTLGKGLTPEGSRHHKTPSRGYSQGQFLEPKATRDHSRVG